MLNLRSTLPRSKLAWAGRYEAPAGVSCRAVTRRASRCPLCICCRGPRGSALRPGLRHPRARVWCCDRRPRGQLSGQESEANLLGPGLRRLARGRVPFLLSRGLGRRPVRGRDAPGQLRHPARRGHELRPQDPAQLLLEPVDQPRDPLPGLRLCVGLPVRLAGLDVGRLPGRVLERIAPAPDGGAIRPPEGLRHLPGRRDAPGCCRLHLHPAADL